MKNYCIVLLLLFPVLMYAQVGSRRVHNDKNPYRDSYQRVSCGANFTLEIRNGALWAYGYNLSGALGDGTTVNENTPEQIGSATNWMMLSAGVDHSLGIQSDGTLWAWGANDSGQIGNGAGGNVLAPQQISADSTWISISAGNAYSLAIKADGTLWAWGGNFYGELGDGTNTGKNSPVQIGSSNNWVTISTHGNRSYGIRSDGTLWAWGDNTSSSLGDGTKINRNAPVQIGTGNNWVNVSGGPLHTLALQANGTLWAWGANAWGGLGDGTIASKTTPVQIGTSNNWVQAEAGRYYSLGVKADGSLWAWGNNNLGQLGDSTNTNRNIPTQIATSNKWVAVSAGAYQSFALSANGLLNGWGYNFDGELGDGTNTNKNLPEVISSVVNWVKIAPGANHTQALRSDGTLWGWGNGSEGDSTGITRLSPVKVYGNAIWVNVEAGVDFSVGIQEDGTLWAWGDNYYGQVGDGTSGGMATRLAPVQISNTNDWESLTAGGDHAMALKANGTIWTWGNNAYGALGRTNGNYTTPQQMGADTDWVQLEAGGGGNGLDHAFGIKSNGTLWAWGANTVGQLGNGGYSGGTTPMQIGAENDWVCVSAGQGFSEGIKADGSLWGWGGNAYNMVGNGSNANTPSPVQINAGTNNWVNVTTGTLHADGLRSDGALWAWGYNFSGQLGNGNYGTQGTPVKAVPFNGWGAIGAGSEANSSLAIKPDRLSYCATGADNGGQLGNGNTTQRNTYSCTALIVNTPPVAKFTANPLAICVGSKVTFNDQSTGTPIGWKWTFTGGSPGTSITNTQVVEYDSAGVYSVKLVVTNAAGADSTLRTSYITVSQPPVITIFPSDTLLCAGNVVTLTATGASSYAWSPAGINLNDSTLSATLDSSATFIIIGTTLGCSDTTSVDITIKPLPKAGLISSPLDTVCAGSSPVLTLGGSTGNIQWQVSADSISFIGIPGDSLTTYIASNILQTSYYRVKVSNSCGNDTSDLYKLLVNALPVPVVYTNDSLICSDDSTILQTTLNYSSYKWSDADTRAYTYASLGGGYWVSVTDVNGCSAVSNHVSIRVYPVPSVSITVQGDTLSSFGASSYQWYFNDSIINAATSTVYVAHSTGEYAVQIVDSNGCPARSNNTLVTITGLADLSGYTQWNIYPNPVAGLLFVTTGNENVGIQVVDIYDVLGRMVLNKEISGQPAGTLTLDVSALPAGVFYITIRANGMEYTHPVIKQ